jgi:hypothetical protein
VTEVPVLVVDVFEVWEGEFLLEKSGEFFLDGLCPMTYKDDELVDVPGYSTTKIILCQNLSKQMGIVDEGHAFFGCFLHLLGSKFLFANAEEIMLFWIVPKDTYAWHLLVEGSHVVHQRLSVFIV